MTSPKRHNAPIQVYTRVAVLLALPLALVALIPSLYAVYRVWQVADDAQSIAQENRAATCSFVADLRQRYISTERYIRLVEQGKIPIFGGVTLTDLKSQNESRRATLASFSGLSCPTNEGG